MRLGVDIEADRLEKIIVLYSDFPGQLKSSRQSGLGSAGYLVRRSLRQHIEESVSWPAVHPLTRNFRRAYNKSGEKWHRRFRFKGAFHFLGKFARYRVTNGQVRVSFGKAKDKFDPGIQRIAGKAEYGYKIHVSARMRRMFGATKRRGDKPGIDFFPLRRSTRVLSVPARPMEKPVFSDTKDDIFPVFQRNFIESLSKKTELADKEFKII